MTITFVLLDSSSFCYCGHQPLVAILLLVRNVSSLFSSCRGGSEFLLGWKGWTGSTYVAWAACSACTACRRCILALESRFRMSSVENTEPSIPVAWFCVCGSRAMTPAVAKHIFKNFFFAFEQFLVPNSVSAVTSSRLWNELCIKSCSFNYIEIKLHLSLV